MPDARAQRGQEPDARNHRPMYQTPDASVPVASRQYQAGVKLPVLTRPVPNRLFVPVASRQYQCQMPVASASARCKCQCQVTCSAQCQVACSGQCQVAFSGQCQVACSRQCQIASSYQARCQLPVASAKSYSSQRLEKKDMGHFYYIFTWAQCVLKVASFQLGDQILLLQQE